MGEGFIIWGYIVVGRGSKLDIKGLSFFSAPVVELSMVHPVHESWLFFHKYRIHNNGHIWTCANLIVKEFRIALGGCDDRHPRGQRLESTPAHYSR
jgi:hypothetical protein